MVQSSTIPLEILITNKRVVRTSFGLNRTPRRRRETARREEPSAATIRQIEYPHPDKMGLSPQYSVRFAVASTDEQKMAAMDG